LPLQEQKSEGAPGAFELGLIRKFAKFCSETVVLDRGAHPYPEDVYKYPGGASPHAFYNMKNLINKFTNKYISFKAYFRRGGGLKQRTITSGRRVREKIKL